MFLFVLIIFYSIPLTASLSVFVNYTWAELQLLSRNLNLNFKKIVQDRVDKLARSVGGEGAYRIS